MKIMITNDGATILKSVPVENPAAKVLVEIAKTQDDTIGDGTTRFERIKTFIYSVIDAIFNSVLLFITTIILFC